MQAGPLDGGCLNNKVNDKSGDFQRGEGGVVNENFSVRVQIAIWNDIGVWISK